MSLPPIELLNTSTEAQFVATLHVLFEPAPPLATFLLQNQPYDSYEALLQTATTAVTSPDTFSDVERREILNAHPRIGANTAHLSELSRREQGNAGATSAEALHALQRALEDANCTYESLCGFKFVTFVNGRSRAVILEEMHRIILDIQQGERTPDMEIQRGLHDMMRIAQDRLGKLATRRGAMASASQL